MFKKPIVIIVGAGASCEYGLPLGSALKSSAAQKLRFIFQHGRLTSGDQDLLNHIRRHTRNDQTRNNAYTIAANELSRTMETFISIDEALHFVSASPEAVEIGKVAVVSEILAAERRSSLAPSKETGQTRLKDVGWLPQMLSMAVAGVQKSEIETVFKQTTLVNFNYDRCIEHYLYEALQQKAGVSREQSGRIVNALTVIRPYGSLGPLEWQEPPGVAFAHSGHVDPFSLIGGIRTYTEQNALHDSEKVERALKAAELVIFLGFGFHQQNMEVLALKPSFARKQGLELLATIVGIHRENLESISSRLGKLLAVHPAAITLQDMRSAELLQELRPRIMNRIG
jgi:hypothetical protein